MKEAELLSEEYWTNRYQEGQIGWDIGYASPPLTDYFEIIEDKNISILIPGAGNAYEAIYLYENCFTDITVCDLSELPLKKFEGHPVIKSVKGDFFDLNSTYDLILEQTFFCAISPILREKYITKMCDLLKENGRLIGLLFANAFEKEGPPYGGSEKEYKTLFGSEMDFIEFKLAENSIKPRKNNEFFFIAQKKVQ